MSLSYDVVLPAEWRKCPLLHAERLITLGPSRVSSPHQTGLCLLQHRTGTQAVTGPIKLSCKYYKNLMLERVAVGREEKISFILDLLSIEEAH